MRFSSLIGRTLRQPPSDAHLASHQLLVRAGYVRGLDAGLVAYLPLGVLARQRLETLLRRALAAIGSQELAVPPTTTAAAVAGQEIDSYRQLPAIVFELRAHDAPGAPLSWSRAGLFGAAERPVAHVHVLAADPPAAAQPVAEAFDRLLAACDVAAVWAAGASGEQRLYLAHAAGDESLVRCPACGYAAERSCAALAPAAPPPDEPQPLPEEIETPDCNTIAALAEFLDVPAARTLKMVFYSVDGRVTCVVIRGDRTVDDARLARLLGTDRYYASVEDELAAIGAVGGYASPIGLRRDRVRVVADPTVRSGCNWITGANRPGWHLRYVNLPRDFEPDAWVDLALIEPGDPCPRCSGPLVVDNAFRLATGGVPQPAGDAGRPSLDESGRPQAMWAADWQLDLGRLLAAIAEQHHDDYGLVWPAACAPLGVHLLALDLHYESGGQTVAAQAEALYQHLQAEGLVVLYDDREASAGVKFADADLIGLPLRLTVGKRSLADGSIEAKWRASPDRLKLDETGLAAELRKLQSQTC